MSKSSQSGCGCFSLLLVVMIVGYIVQFCERKAPPPPPATTYAPTEYDIAQKKAKDDADRIQSEKDKLLKEQKDKNKKKNIENMFVFSELTVKDKYTGLIWTRKGNFGDSGWHNALEIIKELNNKNYGGYNNWRLPSKKELTVMVDHAYVIGGDPNYARPYDIFNDIGFFSVECGNYWSGSREYKGTQSYRVANNKTNYVRNYEAWAANMCNGDVTGHWNTADYKHYVWPVRNGK